ncbi:MAG: hypothetical protein WAM22_00260 [Nitrososphaeraceae archaeon]
MPNYYNRNGHICSMRLNIVYRKNGGQDAKPRQGLPLLVSQA